MANLYNRENSRAINEKGYEPRSMSTEVPVKVNFFGKFIWYISFIFLIPIFIHISWVNYFRRQQMKISSDASLIDTQLAKRAGTILKLVESVSSHMKFEKDVMTQVAAYRSAVATIREQSGNTSADAMAVRQNFESQTESFLTRFMAQFEKYPELKSAELVKGLNDEIVECENNIASARRIYNTSATTFNQEIFTYPKNVVASSMRLTTILLFQAKEVDRQDVSVKLY